MPVFIDDLMTRCEKRFQRHCTSAFSPTNEKQWFHAHWRGEYLLDRASGKEEISFSTAPDKPKDEVKINLNPTNDKHEP